MKKLIVVFFALVAFSAVSFADDAANTGAPANTETTTQTTHTKKHHEHMHHKKMKKHEKKEKAAPAEGAAQQ